MNAEEIFGLLDRQVVDASTSMQKIMQSTSPNDPSAMLQMQFELQKYTTTINYSSSIMKAYKDMIAGIIQKFS